MSFPSDDPYLDFSGTDDIFGSHGESTTQTALDPVGLALDLTNDSTVQASTRINNVNQTSTNSNNGNNGNNTGSNNTSRKRPRISPPITPPPSGNTNQIPSATNLARQILSHDVSEMAFALNTLLKVSADTDANYALGRGGEKVMEAMVERFDQTLGWTKGNSELEREEDDAYEEDLAPSAQTWLHTASPSYVTTPLSSVNVNVSWATFCATKLAPTSLNTAPTPSHILPCNLLSKEEHAIHLLDMIIMILRNLSYVAANVRYLAHSVGILRILTGSLYFRNFSTGKSERGPKSDREESGELGTGNSANNMCLHAVQTLHNLSPFLDSTGRKLFADLLLLDARTDAAETESDNNGPNGAAMIQMGFGGMQIAKRFEIRDENLSKIPDYIIRPVVKLHVRAIHNIFPALVSLLSVTTSRYVLVSTLEWMMALVDNADNSQVFLGTPDIVLYHLVRMLWIPRLGPDSLEYVDPMMNMVTRVGALKLLTGYDATVDFEVRDRSLELLVKLVALSFDLKRRLGRRIIAKHSDSYGVMVVVDAKATNQWVLNTRLYDALLPALTTKVGREHTPQFAAKILKYLAMVPENRAGMMYVQRKVMKAASSNPMVASIVWDGVLNQVF